MCRAREGRSVNPDKSMVLQMDKEENVKRRRLVSVTGQKTFTTSFKSKSRHSSTTGHVSSQSRTTQSLSSSKRFPPPIRSMHSSSIRPLSSLSIRPRTPSSIRPLPPSSSRPRLPSSSRPRMPSSIRQRTLASIRPLSTSSFRPRPPSSKSRSLLTSISRTKPTSLSGPRLPSSIRPRPPSSSRPQLSSSKRPLVLSSNSCCPSDLRPTTVDSTRLLSMISQKTPSNQQEDEFSKFYTIHMAATNRDQYTTELYHVQFDEHGMLHKNVIRFRGPKKNVTEKYSPFRTFFKLFSSKPTNG